MALNDYLKQVQRFTRDQNQKILNPEDLTEYVNRARREIALRTGCVRVLSPSSGQVVSATITAGGTGYVTPVATISAPDFPSNSGANPGGAQATATVQQIGGVISNISIDYGGSGYFSPVITITDSTGPGTGATATLATTPITVTADNQEVYAFEDIPLTSFPGVAEVYFVNSISIIYSAYRYSLMTYSFSTYQAKIRNYPKTYTYVPSIWSQMGRGSKGLAYLYPVASAPYQLEFDCCCLPQTLTDDGSEEAIPLPWTDCIPYFAAHLAYLEMQNLNSAQYYLGLYEKMASNYSSFTVPRRVSNRYGRW